MMDQLKEIVMGIADGVAYSVAFTTIVGLLPPLAALASIIWISYQLYHAEKKRRKEERKQNGQAEAEEAAGD